MLLKYSVQDNCGIHINEDQNVAKTNTFFNCRNTRFEYNDNFGLGKQPPSISFLYNSLHSDTLNEHTIVNIVSITHITLDEFKNSKLGKKDIYHIVFFDHDNKKLVNWFIDEHIDDVQDMIDECFMIVLSQDFIDLKQKISENPVTEGVWTCTMYAKDINKKILNTYVRSNEYVFHPGSNKITRDFIHPSMNPLANPEINIDSMNMWKRKHEQADYQWIPSDGLVDENFNVTITSTIIGHENGSLLPVINKILSKMMPGFDQIYNYGKNLSFGTEQEYENAANFQRTNHTLYSLKNKQIQIFTKLVTYHFKPGESFEGVWHYEGLPHENIFATGIYYFESKIESKIEFKREFTLEEVHDLLHGLSQDRIYDVDDHIKHDYIPLGTQEIREDMMLVFPNSHAHKVHKMINNTDHVVRRSMLVFFFVDPEMPIVSTGQIDISIVNSKEEKLDNITKTMEERRVHKSTMNPREIHLCEH